MNITEKVAAAVELTKPRALVMIVFTTSICYLIAATDQVDWLNLALTTVGVLFAAGGSLAPIGFQVDGFGLTGDAGVLFFDIPFCVLLCGLVIPLMKNGMMLTRANGYMLLAVYVIYLAVLLVRSL